MLLERQREFNNLILATDSYKLNHWNQYPKDTEAVYSYLESRSGAKYPYTVFFGLQYLLKRYLDGHVVTFPDLHEASDLAISHFGKRGLFNYRGWAHIIDEHQGKLPLRIKAVPEGTKVPVGNVMMTVENTCPECFWVTNAIESLLTHVWYSSTVATMSNATIEMMGRYLDVTAEGKDGLPYMLHDFGYRGASSHETAGIGGAAHLVNSLGTDTLPGMLLAQDYYGANLDELAFSVPATEHSVMTARGPTGEWDVVDQLIEEYPTGVLSVVADSYDVYTFVEALGTKAKDRILARDGVFVVRPDSVTHRHQTPGSLMVALSKILWRHFGGEENGKGFKVLDPHVRLLWGDGINQNGIREILEDCQVAGFSAENYVFGMGGGLLQKVNRDTQRFAFKASAIKRDGEWQDIQKMPLDQTKTSKAGRLALIEGEAGIRTVPWIRGEIEPEDTMLSLVFEDGNLANEITFEEVRKNAGLLE